jgi:hypothetical protein
VLLVHGLTTRRDSISSWNKAALIGSGNGVRLPREFPTRHQHLLAKVGASLRIEVASAGRPTAEPWAFGGRVKG